MESTTPAKSPSLLQKPWLRYGGGGVVGLVVLFGLLGNFWLPGFAKQKLEELLSDQLHRPVTVQEIDVSPFALSLTVRGFAVGELPSRVAKAVAPVAGDAAARDSTGSPPLLAFDELFVDLSAMSIVRRAPVISEVRLAGPKIHVERDADGRYSISDLIDQWTNQPAPPTNDAPPTKFSVANIQITNGRIDFLDHPKSSHQEISDLNLGIPFLANFVSDEPVWVEPHFSAKVNGAEIALEGKALPFAERREASLALKFNDFDLTRIDEYAPVPLKLKLAALKLDSDLNLSFAQPPGAEPEISLAGTIRLHDLDLQTATQPRSLLKLQALDVRLGKVDLAKRKVHIERILVQGFDADILRRKNGKLELVELTSTAGAPKKAAKEVTKDDAKPIDQPPTKWSVGAEETLFEDIRLRYRDDSAQTPFVATIGQMSATVRNVELDSETPILFDWHSADVNVRRVADKTPLFNLPSSSIGGGSVSLKQQKIMLTSVELNAPRLSVVRNSDGVLDLLKLAGAAPAQATPTTDKPTSKATSKATSASPWQAKVESFVIADAGIDFIDKTLAQPLPLKVSALTVKVTDVDSAGAGKARIDVKGVVNKRGRLQVDGATTFSPFGVNLAIAVKDIDLIPLQGWAGDRLNALITKGEFSFNGRVKADGEPMAVAVKGDARLTNFNLLDRDNTADLLKWRSFDVGGINLTTAPLKVDVATVALSDFFAKIILSSSGRLNLKDIMKSDPATVATDQAAANTGGAVATASPASANANSAAQGNPANAAAVATTAALPVRIGSITLQGGRVDFTDNFIKPNYSANLSALGGRIGPLQAGTMGDVEIRGLVNTSAPLEILGKVDPFSQVLALDIGAKAKGIDLPTFSPYSGKYVGYVIDKGKLSVDVKYRVTNGELAAENSIFIDQLTFGNRVESPDALSVPVTLAVALLKNSRGEIDIQLPVSGSLNDPKFSIGSLIWKVLGNLIVKAVTSPFALLGSLFGGGEELSQIEFAPGRGQLTPEAEKRMQSLSKALTDRTGLKLEVTGRADPENDREGLKRAVLDRKVKAQKLAESVKRGDAVSSLQEVIIAPDEYQKYLALAYKEEKFPKPKNLIGFTKSLPVAEMEQLMLTHIEAGKKEMQELAEVRARVAQEWIVQKGGIATERVFVLTPKIEAEADGKKVGSRVEFSLR
jgi:uncharacterized protein involved in outer membrane biogenesis